MSKSIVLKIDNSKEEERPRFGFQFHKSKDKVTVNAVDMKKVKGTTITLSDAVYKITDAEFTGNVVDKIVLTDTENTSSKLVLHNFRIKKDADDVTRVFADGRTEKAVKSKIGSSSSKISSSKKRYTVSLDEDTVVKRQEKFCNLMDTLVLEFTRLKTFDENNFHVIVQKIIYDFYGNKGKKEMQDYILSYVNASIDWKNYFMIFEIPSIFVKGFGDDRYKIKSEELEEIETEVRKHFINNKSLDHNEINSFLKMASEKNKPLVDSIRNEIINKELSGDDNRVRFANLIHSYEKLLNSTEYGKSLLKTRFLGLKHSNEDDVEIINLLKTIEFYKCLIQRSVLVSFKEYNKLLNFATFILNKSESNLDAITVKLDTANTNADELIAVSKDIISTNMLIVPEIK